MRLSRLPFSPDNMVMSPDTFMIAVTNTETGQFAAIDIEGALAADAAQTPQGGASTPLDVAQQGVGFVLDQTFYRPSKVVFSSDSVFVFISDRCAARS